MNIPTVLLCEIAHQAHIIHSAPQPPYVPFDPQGDIVEAIACYRANCVEVLEGDEWDNPEAMSQEQADHLTKWAQSLESQEAMKFIQGEY